MFNIATVVFGVYDFVVQKGQKDLIAQAERTNKLVSDLFPRNVKERLLGDEYSTPGTVDDFDAASRQHFGGTSNHSGHVRSDMMPRASSMSKINPYETKPIADLFVSTDVCRPGPRDVSLSDVDLLHHSPMLQSCSEIWSDLQLGEFFIV